MLNATRHEAGEFWTNGDIMSDTNSTADSENSSNDETPMVPHELTPEQLSDDPVVGDPAATGAAGTDAADAPADDSDD
ncbi:hypothetical protein [Microbacterium hydrocarbonoxydans]|uniref:hypothetical protein n=1 Tax=Microbacterium hydrocarbonoxydans TaxID=273678 RepID=UPI00203E7F78|nr:hypothetical protein [Microbacterium hydrocarbonoxydans]MCM3779743.1 hypothetical protein [Microbacterium hydrocarbonoxydans]